MFDQPQIYVRIDRLKKTCVRHAVEFNTFLAFFYQRAGGNGETVCAQLTWESFLL